ncbi:MAG: hypothetical protein LBQ59_01605 [Candidatus Peribacteria bacterium]|nr:hypothetical protein [Candidatus Peribacteria bacterium]
MVLYNDTKIVEDETFVPNYSQVLGFRVYNNSKEKLNIERFDIQVL